MRAGPITKAAQEYMQGVYLGWTAPIARAEEWVPKIEAEAVANIVKPFATEAEYLAWFRDSDARVAAERARIAEAVRGLPTSEAAWGSVPVVVLAAVLDIVKGETP
jgi:hypothetical protein